MDKKISELATVVGAGSADIIPIVSGGANKSISVLALARSLPSVGNSGTTTNIPISASVTAIPLTSTVVQLSLQTHTLASGTAGQEITLIGSGTNAVTLTGAGTLTTINFPAIGSTVTLLYVGSAWNVKSHFSVTFA